MSDHTKLPPADAINLLSDRECDVAALVVKGYGDAEIAAALGTAERTVNNQLGSIYRRLGIHRRTVLVRWWLTHFEDDTDD